jgi:YD repeat-containing protein
MIDSSGTTSYTYDNLNRVSTKVDPTSTTLTYAYDGRSNVTSVASGVVGTYTYGYDLLDRATGMTTPYSESSTFAYDNDSRRTATNLANGIVVSNSYDGVSNLTGRNNTLSSTTISGATYTYNGANIPTGAAEASGNSTTWTYDNAYQLNGQNYVNVGLAWETLTSTQWENLTSGQWSTLPAVAPSYTLGLTYDSCGNPLVATIGGGTTTSTYGRIKGVGSLFWLSAARGGTPVRNPK